MILLSKLTQLLIRLKVKTKCFSVVGKNGKGETNIMYNYFLGGKLSPLIYLLNYGSFRTAGIYRGPFSMKT